MKIDAYELKLSFFVFLFSIVTACNSAEFSSQTKLGSKKSSDNSAEPSAEPAPSEENAEASIEGQLEQTGSPTGEFIINADGSVSDRFFGIGAIRSTVKVDVIIATDTSGSMGTEKRKLEQNMEMFLKKFSETPGVDHQVFAIGAAGEIPGFGRTGYDFNFPELDPNRFEHIEQHVDSNTALRRIRDFINGRYDTNLKLRENTVKEILVVTDDDSNLSANDFKNFLASKEAEYGQFHVNGFVWVPGETDNGYDWCTRADDGEVYVELGKDPKFGGLIEHLCTEDWAKLLDKLAGKIINQNAKVSFELTKKVDQDKQITVEVNGEKISEEKWDYDQEGNAIVFNDDSAPESGDNLLVTYFALEGESELSLYSTW